jgi:hypothetical protein
VICVSFSPALKQSGRVKIIKFGAALGEVARVSFSVFVFTAALSARHTESTKRDLRRWALPVLSLSPVAASAIEGERCAPPPRIPQQPTPAAQEGWNAFENGFVGADSHSQTHSQKNSSLFSHPHETICIQSHRALHRKSLQEFMIFR